MKEYKCPNCCALLRFAPDDDIVKCEYCGTVVDLERSSDEISAKKARILAERIREYRNINSRLNEARNDVSAKTAAYNEIREQRKSITPGVIIAFVLVWIFVSYYFACLIHEPLYFHDGLRIFLDLVFAAGSGAVVYLFARITRSKFITENRRKEKQAYADKEASEELYSELLEKFDENFLPENVRNDAATDFLIKALETQRAYTLSQAINLWEDKLLYESHKELYCAYSEKPDGDKDKSDAEVIGAFAGAALGAFGGSVARKAVKEIIRRL